MAGPPPCVGGSVMRLITAGAIVALVAAGCIGAPEAATIDAAALPVFGARADAAWIDEALVVDHDHSDLAAHALQSPTMSALAHTSFDALGAGAVAFGEADLLGEDHVVLAGFVGAGFVIADVSDPASPTGVSFTPDPGMQGDVKASESGNFVFVGRQVGQWQGVQAYNTVVKERPVPAGFYPIVGTMPFRGGCHMLAVHNDYLYCAPNDNTVRIMRIVETPGAVALLPAGVYAPQGPPLAPIVAGESQDITHDMTVQDDPITGKPVMYVSFWDYGLRVVDVSDPTAPTELGAWMGEGTEEWGTYFGAVHTSMAGLVDVRSDSEDGEGSEGGVTRKRILVSVPEYADVPAVTFIDATDYADMKAIGVWAPLTAEDLGDQASSFSTHNFQFIGGKVYLAMYHGGVWVIDASTPEKLAAPTAVGYFLPSEARPTSLPSSPDLLAGGGSVWDVLVKDGVILATDMTTGLYAIQLADDVGKDLTSFA